jgi:hypothetical protein
MGGTKYLGYIKYLKPATFDLWLAVNLRVAQLKQEIPAASLWDRDDDLFDPQVFGAMTPLDRRTRGRRARGREGERDHGLSSEGARA